MKRVIVMITAAVLAFSIAVPDENEKKLLSISDKVEGMEKQEGFFNFYLDDSEGKIWLEIDAWDAEFLYVTRLTHGIGSNDIGLDRGRMGSERVMTFRRSGPKVLLVEPNYDFRAVGGSPSEKKAVEESFAQSVHWGFKVGAADGDRVLVDATEFFLRDALNIASTLKSQKQGDYRLEASRSALLQDRTKNFPTNTEVEALITFTGTPSGWYIRSVVPDARSVSVRQQHSFIQLPDDGYRPRRYDPRAGYWAVSYMDYATPIDQPVVKRFISRHRLQKKDPAAAMSEPVEPIMYFLDPGVPEPIRSALLDGARWWNQAFEAAGYVNAFRVDVLPDGADPMDIRYNIIQWVHRSTRGWSYGGGITDPRTGEIIQGNVSLGSLRVRQDYLIAQGLLSPFGDESAGAANGGSTDAMTGMALARLRQLSAHEVGHTLGIGHNFAASVNNRASVMDYPHPFVQLKPDGSIDLSAAYDDKIGDWDKVVVAYGYQDFPDGIDEQAALDKMMSDALSRGLKYITDSDARPAGGAHPDAHLWDNSPDPVSELRRVMDVRKAALGKLSESSIGRNAEMGQLEYVLVPVYLFHRYQVEAAVKLVGGLSYSYALRGDGQTVTEIVPASSQRRAVSALLATISPATLAMPEELIQKIPPQPGGRGRTRESFQSRTGLTFDPLAPVEAATRITVSLLLNSQRAARLVEYSGRSSAFPGLGEVIDSLLNATWKRGTAGRYYPEVQRAINNTVLDQLIRLAADKSAPGQVRAVASLKLDDLKTWQSRAGESAADESQKAHYLYAASQIGLFQTDPSKFEYLQRKDPPPGSPIGDACGSFGGDFNQ